MCRTPDPFGSVDLNTKTHLHTCVLFFSLQMKYGVMLTWIIDLLIIERRAVRPSEARRLTQTHIILILTHIITKSKPKVDVKMKTLKMLWSQVSTEIK